MRGGCLCSRRWLCSKVSQGQGSGILDPFFWSSQRHLTALTTSMPLQQRPAVREEAGRAGAVEALLAVLRGTSHEPALQARPCQVLAADVRLPLRLWRCPMQRICDALRDQAHTMGKPLQPIY